MSQGRLELKPFMIEIRNAEVGNLSNPSRMIDGEYNTVDEKHMWLAPMPAPPNNLEILITIPASIQLGGMRLWNYNKSFLDSVKGIRELEVLLNGNVMWYGIVNRGCGNKFDVYSTDVKLLPEFEFVKNTITSPKPEFINRRGQEDEDERPNSVPMWLAGHNPIIAKPQEKEEETKRPVQNSARLRPNPSQPIVPTFDKIVTKPVMKIDEDTNNLIKALNMKKSSFTCRDKKPVQPNFEPFKVVETESRKEEVKKEAVKSEESQLNLNPSRRRLFQEPLKESLDSLEYFKITNENRIQRERARRLQVPDTVLPSIQSPGVPDLRKQIPPKETEPKQDPIKVIQDFKETFAGLNLQDPIEKFLADEERKDSVSADQFKIPYFPKGKVLKISILSTWGDQHYVGLSGIELFDQFGTLIKFREPKKHITADPPDVNILPGYGTDPRTIDKLLDGVNWTCDDLHVWLAPFTAGQEHSITIDLGEGKALSMMRVWNYNKSRIHSYRGAKDVIITLDGKQVIFKGELAKAPGRMKDADQHCEYIMFTKDEKILTRIEKSDWVQHHAQANSDEVEAELMSTIRLTNRPGTASKHVPPPLSKDPNSFLGEDGRPLTTAIMNPVPTKTTASTRAPSSGLAGRHIRISLLETWGDSFYIGLTGIEVLGSDGPIRLDRSMVDANPRDMNVIPGYSGDYRTLDKLINGKNVTTDDHNMWLIPFTPGKSHNITVDLLSKQSISGLKFWNYNKNQEDTARGVKRISISIDGQHHGEIAIRKAPGNSEYDYGQTITLPSSNALEDMISIPGPPIFASILVTQDSETPYLPIGYILKIRLFSTWGDMHYIGMNGLEIYDMRGRPVLRNPNNSCSITSIPHSVREIPGMENDVRTPDKLINGVNFTSDDRNMWLAPYQNSSSYYSAFAGARKPNEIVLTFEKQICIGYIKFWNYGKTVNRGVKEYEILLDDMIIYRGMMRPANNTGDWGCAVLFTGDSNITGAAQGLVYRLEESNKENVLLYNEGKLVGGAEEEAKVQMGRPQTSVVIH
jgi:hypothetical protein